MLTVMGCGRLGFDSVDDAAASDGPNEADTLLGHDEDGDGVPDSADLCPHLAEAVQADADGDLVGDRCDPEPAVARQSWRLFAPMTGDDGGFAAPSSWTQEEDSLRIDDDTLTTTLIRTMVLSNTDVWVGFDMLTPGATGRQLSIVIRPQTGPYFYGEVFDAGTAMMMITEFDGTSFVTRSQNPVPGGFPTGPTSLHLKARSGPNPTFDLAGEFPGGTEVVGAAAPGYAGADFLIIGVQRVRLDVRYVAIIDTAP